MAHMGDGGAVCRAAAGQHAALRLRLDGAGPLGRVSGRHQRIHVGAHEAAGGAVGPVDHRGVHRPAQPASGGAAGCGIAGGAYGHPPAVLRLRGRHRISRGGGGCADLSGGGAAGLLGQHGTPEAGDTDRTGVAGGGSAGAGSGLHRLRGVDRVAAGAADIHRPHQRDAGHPIIHVRKSRRSAAHFLDRGGRMVYNETTKQP